MVALQACSAPSRPARSPGGCLRLSIPQLPRLWFLGGTRRGWGRYWSPSSPPATVSTHSHLPSCIRSPLLTAAWLRPSHLAADLTPAPRWSFSPDSCGASNLPDAQRIHSGWVTWLERRPLTPKGCGFDPWSGTVRRQPVNVSFLFSPHLSLKSINMSSGEDLKKKNRTAFSALSHTSGGRNRKSGRRRCCTPSEVSRGGPSLPLPVPRRPGLPWLVAASLPSQPSLMVSNSCPLRMRSHSGALRERTSTYLLEEDGIQPVTPTERLTLPTS